MGSPVAFALRGATKRYGAAGLGPVDLDVGAGITTAVLGPSGCGKSTLLRLLIGLLVPDAGTVLFDGAPLQPSARLRIGYVIQDGGLFPHLTAAGNVTLVARYLRLGRRRDRPRGSTSWRRWRASRPTRSRAIRTSSRADSGSASA